MTVETYGEHAEHAARALNLLVREGLLPSDPAAVNQLLQCREAVVDALRQRRYDLGVNTWTPVTALPTPPTGMNLAGIDNKLATLLDNIAFSVPNLPVDERHSSQPY